VTAGRGRAPLRFAHRAGGARAPENTLAACAESIRLGVDALEIDVRATADGVPVLMHDESVDRTTNGRGPVADLTLDRLKRLDAGTWFHPRFRGERVATLEETLDLARGHCGVNIELKIGQGRAPLSPPFPRHLDPALLVHGVVAAMTRVRFDHPIIVSSFEPKLLALTRAARADVHLGLIAKWTTRGLSAAHRRVRLQSVHLHTRLAVPRRLSAARRLGLSIFVWSVRDLNLMQQMITLGVDGIMCPDPALFAQARTA